MTQNKKVVAVVCAFAVVVCSIVGIILVSVNSNNEITIVDCNGEMFAEVTLKGSKEIIAVTDDAYREYAHHSFEEAIELYTKEFSGSRNSVIDTLFNKGAVIKTNFSTKICKSIESAFKENSIGDSVSQCCAVTDNNGGLVAVYGKGRTNGTVYSEQKNYACSTIKPLSVYAPAINAGIIDWSATYTDRPYKNVVDSEGVLEPWPSNSSGTYTYTDVTVNEALAESYNTVAVEILKDFGVKRSVDFLDKVLGIDVSSEREKMNSGGEDEILSNIALGYLSNGVSAIDLAGYYSMFVADGNYAKPRAVKVIESKNGKVLLTVEDAVLKPISEQTAFVMTKLLQNVVKNGTGKYAAVEGIDIAGKTGTSSGNADNWFVGYTNEFSCSVWHDNGSNQQNIGNKAPDVFADVIKELPINEPNFKDSCSGVEERIYCKRSGALKSDKCSDFATGYYAMNFKKSVCNECLS